VAYVAASRNELAATRPNLTPIPERWMFKSAHNEKSFGSALISTETCNGCVPMSKNAFYFVKVLPLHELTYSPCIRLLEVVVLWIMEQLPRLVNGNCPECDGTEIVVKKIQPDGTTYEGYCPGCGIDIVGALIDGATRAVVLN